MTIDLVVLSLLLAPVMNLVARYTGLYVFQSFLAEYGFDAFTEDITRMPEFASYITISDFLLYVSILTACNILFMGIYFIVAWYKFGTTIGKLVLQMRVVDSDNYSQLPLYNCIKRFLGYLTAFIVVWFLLFSKRGIALHDRIAHSVVIKK